MCEKITEIRKDIKSPALSFFVEKLLLLGFLYLIFFSIQTVPLNAAPDIACTISITPDYNNLVADCSYKSDLDNYFDLPQDLDANINVLNISHNTFHNITKKSFARYASTLTILDMAHFDKRDPTSVFEEDIFSTIRNLEVLVVNHCTYLKNPIFPEKLRILFMAECHSHTWNLAHLLKLDKVVAYNNTLTTFPSFVEMTPLTYLDLRNNPIPLANLSLKKIAPFCLLKVFLLGPEVYAGPHTLKTFCNCLGIQNWLINLDIVGTPLLCVPPSRGAVHCKFDTDDEVKKLRQDCLNHLETSTPIYLIKKSWKLIVFILLMILFSLSIPVIWLTRKKFGVETRKRRRKRKRLVRRITSITAEGYEEELEEEYYEDIEGEWEEEVELEEK